MKEINYYAKAIDEIVEMIRENIYVYLSWSDETFLSLREYCNENYDNEYKSLNYNRLLSFTKEALDELINCHHLYDFRTLE